MRKGKMVSQGAHASMKFILDRGYYGKGALSREEFHSNITDPAIKSWISGIFTKICVSVDSEEELVSIYEKAQDSGLIVSMVTDSGLTEFNGVPTKTCIAIGPNWSDEIDAVTGHLKLL